MRGSTSVSSPVRARRIRAGPDDRRRRVRRRRRGERPDERVGVVLELRDRVHQQQIIELHRAVVSAAEHELPAPVSRDQRSTAADAGHDRNVLCPQESAVGLIGSDKYRGGGVRVEYARAEVDRQLLAAAEISADHQVAGCVEGQRLRAHVVVDASRALCEHALVPQESAICGVLGQIESLKGCRQVDIVVWIAGIRRDADQLSVPRRQRRRPRGEPRLTAELEDMADARPRDDQEVVISVDRQIHKVVLRGAYERGPFHLA